MASKMNVIQLCTLSDEKIDKLPSEYSCKRYVVGSDVRIIPCGHFRPIDGNKIAIFPLQICLDTNEILS